MNFGNLHHWLKVREAWSQVDIARPVHYELFTFGETVLDYYLVTRPNPGDMVEITRGEVRVARALIITPDQLGPELQNFFDDPEDDAWAHCVLARSAAFSNLRLTNHSGPARIVSDNVEDAVARLNRQLDDREEDRIAILVAPRKLAPLAVFKYTTERILASAPGNLQELRDRGCLPPG